MLRLPACVTSRALPQEVSTGRELAKHEALSLAPRWPEPAIHLCDDAGDHSNRQGNLQARSSSAAAVGG
jgi:hypothetical protein